jgi:hypothetical protein
VFTVGLLFLLIAASTALVFRFIRQWKQNKVRKFSDVSGNFRLLSGLCILWTAVYLIFLFFWIPQNTFYRMFYLPAIIILLGILLNKYRSPDEAGGRAALAVIIVAVSNFLFFIYPYAHVRTETPLSLAAKMNKIWSSKTVVYFSEINADNRLVQYFNPRSKWIKLTENIEPAQLDLEMQAIYDNGGEVWMETSALKKLAQSEESLNWTKQHIAGQPQHKINDPAYNLIFTKLVR